MPEIPFSIVKEEALADPEVKREYDELEDEFRLIRAMLDARAKAGLTQADVAERMGVSQPAVSKIESGKVTSLKTLENYAKAVGGKIRVEIEM